MTAITASWRTHDEVPVEVTSAIIAVRVPDGEYPQSFLLTEIYEYAPERGWQSTLDDAPIGKDVFWWLPESELCDPFGPRQ